MNTEQQTQKVCRTCLNIIANDCDFFNLNSAGLNSQPTTILWHKLRDCVPELDLQIVPNAVVCRDCAAAVDSAYKFKTRCLQTEELIHGYMKNMDSPSTDLAKIVEYYEGVTISEQMQKNHDGLVTDSCYLAVEINTSEELDFSLDVELNSVIKSEPHNMENSLRKLTKKQSSQEFEAQNGIVKTEVDIFKHTENNTESHEPPLLSPKVEIPKLEDIQTLPSLSPNESSQKQFTCEICSYSAAQPIALSKHMQTHLKDCNEHRKLEKKQYACANCDFKTNKKPLLRNHMKVHFTSTIYRCDMCSHISSSPFILLRHKKTHTKPFRCSLCDYRTSASHWLRIHMRKHT